MGSFRFAAGAVLVGLFVVGLLACAGEEGDAEPVASPDAAESDGDPAPDRGEADGREADRPTPEPDTGATAGDADEEDGGPADGEADAEAATDDLPDGVSEAPDWLGERALPERDDGHGGPQPTPDELVDRRLASPEPPDGLEDPEDDEFAASVSAVPDDVAERSTWRPECPVGLDELRYITVTFWGFDERSHTGELLVHRRVADDLVTVFEELHEARFPIEEMRIATAEELDAPPTGDTNNTSAFECRDVSGDSATWSQHAHGLAIDINPFHNPYVKGDLVLPELAEAYLDRDDDRPGMIQPGDVATEAFDRIGWGWGGEWQTLKDWQHFSENGL